jgi:hypothetical protein
VGAYATWRREIQVASGNCTFLGNLLEPSQNTTYIYFTIYIYNGTRQDKKRRGNGIDLIFTSKGG